MGGIFALKVCVYAICKNESQFVERFMDSMSEADDICVLDPGSTDDTVENLRARGAHVEHTIAVTANGPIILTDRSWLGVD